MIDKYVGLEQYKRSIDSIKEYVDKSIPHLEPEVIFTLPADKVLEIYNSDAKAMEFDKPSNINLDYNFIVSYNNEDITYISIMDNEDFKIIFLNNNNIVIGFAPGVDINQNINENKMVVVIEGLNTDITPTDVVLKQIKIKYLNNKYLKNDVAIRNSITIGSRQEGHDIGQYSFSNGEYNISSGNNSHAEGYNTTASEKNSHAEGTGTEASGYSSHAEGNITTASGYSSHAEGTGTEASGDGSHAEGCDTTASENNSHAEGTRTRALGHSSHAEGCDTIASCDDSHAEGRNTRALGDISHAEGYNTTASGNRAHAEGYDTIASGDNSHVQGKYNIEDTENKYAHIIGNGTSDTDRSNAHTVDWEGNAWYQGKLSQDGSPTEDKDLTTKKYVDNKVSGLVDSAPDALNTLNELAAALGEDANFATTVTNSLANKADSDHNHDDAYAPINSPNFTTSVSMGRKTSSNIGTNSVALGKDVTAIGNCSHAEGQLSTASGNYSHAEGNQTSAYDDASHSEGTGTVAKLGSHAEGLGSQATGSTSHAEGYNTKAIGSYSHAEGQLSIATGSTSHAEGSGTQASGDYSHAEGAGTQANGNFSHAEGSSTKASSQYQHVQGKYNIEDSSNVYAHIVGNGNSSLRSNAHTLDWNGNGWYQGKLSQDGTPTEDKDLTTKKYVDDSIANLPIKKIISTQENPIIISNLNDGIYDFGNTSYSKMFDSDTEILENILGICILFTPDQSKRVLFVNFKSTTAYSYDYRYDLDMNTKVYYTCKYSKIINIGGATAGSVIILNEIPVEGVFGIYRTNCASLKLTESSQAVTLNSGPKILLMSRSMLNNIYTYTINVFAYIPKKIVYEYDTSTSEATLISDCDYALKDYVDDSISEQITSSQATDEEVDTMLQAVLGGDYSNEQ